MQHAQRQFLALTIAPEMNPNFRPSILSCFLAVILIIKMLIQSMIKPGNSGCKSRTSEDINDLSHIFIASIRKLLTQIHCFSVDKGMIRPAEKHGAPQNHNIAVLEGGGWYYLPQTTTRCRGTD